MKKSLILILITVISLLSVAFAQSTMTLKTGVAISDRLPKGFFGTWRVVAKLVDTTNPETFKNSSVDLWNLSMYDNVVKLSNPFSGASASVDFNKVEDGVIQFSKKSSYENKILNEIVTIKLDGNSFVGIDEYELYSSNENKSSVKKARYRIVGDKISGDSIQ